MLTEKQYIDYCYTQNRLSQSAIAYIDTVRSSEPSRPVGVHAENNLCTSPMSRKMGHTVSLESRGPEGDFFLLCEFDDRVLEYWDQPDAIKISATNRKEKPYKRWYTPDALVLTSDGVKVIQIKSENEVEGLIQMNPHDWVEQDGSVVFLPAQKAFRSIGLKHEVYLHSNNIRYKTSNIKLLLLSRAERRYKSEQLLRVKTALSEKFYQSLYDLKSEAELDSYEELIQMVDDGILHADLANTLLSSPKGCVATLDPVLLPQAMQFHHAHKIYERDGLIEVPVGSVPTLKHAERALKNLQLVNSGEKSRNISRLKAKIREGANNGMSPFQSLIPEYHRSGNRLPRIPRRVENFLNEYLLTEFAHSPGRSAYWGHKQYSEAAKKKHPEHDPVSLKAFRQRLYRIPPEKIAQARGGRRLANASMAPSNPEDRTLKAQYAWHSAAADHYEADIYLVIFDSNDYVYVARPYVTGLIDLFSKAVIGLSISLLPPSRRSICKVMRDCARRYGRLPEEIIVDRGSDFKSVYFSALLADKGITLTLRPSAHPRYGSEIEGLFGEFKKMWLSQRPGNITDYKEVRAIDRKKAPDKQAILRPYDFYREFERFVEWRGAKQRGIGIESASTALMRSMKDYPFVGKQVEANTEFLIATSVDDKRYKVDFQRGLHIGDQHYWSPKLSSLRGKIRRVDTRIDPENPHVVYAKINNVWSPCYSSQINSYSALDPISQKVAGLELAEASNAKRLMREQADTELIHILREMDAIASSDNVIPIANVLPDDKPESNVFDQIRNAKIEPLESTSWGS